MMDKIICDECGEVFSNEIKEIVMNKEEIVNQAQKYSKNEQEQKAYIAGIQAVCSIVFQKLNTCYNEDFCSEMETLSEACFIEFD